VLLAASDMLRSSLGLPAVYIKLLGRHSELALLTVDEQEYQQSGIAMAAGRRHMVRFFAGG
jgi:uncharacterized protein YigA (DUF484 family)